jgi:antitoxin HicB
MAPEMVKIPSERIAAYLRQPYARLVIPEDDGTFRGEILEFPGCLTTGDTPADALSSLEEVARAWLEGALEHNQPIPAPVENTEFSGRLLLRLPKSLHKKAARFAERDGVSLNQFIVTSLAEHVGERRRPQQQIVFHATGSSMKNVAIVPRIIGPQFVHSQETAQSGLSSITGIILERIG